ncbi:MAG: transcription antitermination factor NusB [Proteobacteria bacterium]|nr:transcription antitermination factor NusB [Pseudomonadota bacterium]MBU1389287.1 transcription antitermination factor NusB [Pseudomonadota bacterium]MBU1544107.1 transcription antitermination factor NusB [Pseudomonadota bacterium]MBU2431375.1 transcription antitermination factor NusB [Pseudomonadota bacterium]MBU2481633.1 transcription antitermination factor NusB [Pseudomonadota bacterium]
MGDRRQARELALQALFFIDVDSSDPEKNLESFCLNNEEELTSAVKPFFHMLVSGVRDNQSRIDDLIIQCSKNWRLSRMPVVDRNIMRIAVFELLKCEDIPPSVTINEAVEIGKKYGTKDSGAFINGVLDRIKSLEGV